MASSGHVITVGTGPFKLQEFQRDATATYQRFGAYWDQGKPYRDGVELRFLRDAQTIKAAFINGDIDAFGTGDRTLIAELMPAGYPHVKGGSGTSVMFLIPDSADPGSPFADKGVRQAVAHTIDREEFVRALGMGLDELAYQWAVPHSEG